MVSKFLRVCETDAYEVVVHVHDMGDWYDGGVRRVRVSGEELQRLGLTPTQAREALELFARRLHEALQDGAGVAGNACGEVVGL